MKICFLMYPWKNVEAQTDSTLRLIHESILRGHTVAITSPHNLTIRESVTMAFCKVIKSSGKVSKNTVTFHKQVDFSRHRLPVAGFDCIFMRTNPPLDSLCLNFLDSVKDDVFIINDVDGLRKANNKLYTASFQDEPYIPKTYVSKNREYLEGILDESDSGRMIMKPLNGYGGRGVIVIEKSARQNARSLLDFYIGEGENSNYVILQEYISGAAKGDVRIMMLNGEPIGAMKRIPNSNDNRSNVSSGGTVEKYNISSMEKKLSKSIGSKLVRDGIYLAGIDVIDGKLIEVNVLSPGGITRINQLNKVKLQSMVLEFVESVVEAKDRILNRKSEYKKVIEDAETF